MHGLSRDHVSTLIGNVLRRCVGWVQGNAQQDPNPFFAAALAAPWGANIVLSPHIYAPCAPQPCVLIAAPVTQTQF